MLKRNLNCINSSKVDEITTKNVFNKFKVFSTMLVPCSTPDVELSVQ